MKINAMDFKQLTIQDFLEQLASKKPLPACGSASAICAAMGAALAGMTAKLTLGKKESENRREELEKIVSICRDLMERLMNLSEKDAAAYKMVLDAMQLAKNTPEEKQIRSRALGKAYKEAAAVPLSILEAAEDLMEISILAVKEGKSDIVADAAAGSYLAWAAAGISAMNIRFNISGIRDESFISKVMSATELTLERIQAISKEAEASVNKFLEHRET